MPEARKTAKTTASVGFTAAERAAMKGHSSELEEAARRGSRATKADGESAAYGLTKLTAADETLIGELVKRAVN